MLLIDVYLENMLLLIITLGPKIRIFDVRAWLIYKKLKNNDNNGISHAQSSNKSCLN